MIVFATPLRAVLFLTSLAAAFICTLGGAQAQSLIRDAEIEEILRDYTDPILEAAGLIPEDVGLYLINDPSLKDKKISCLT